MLAEPVQICFEETELGLLVQDTSLHAIVRLAIDQRVLRIQIETAAGLDCPHVAALAAHGIRVEGAADPENCDYLVQSAGRESPGDSRATPITFDVFRQYVRKMI